MRDRARKFLEFYDIMTRHEKMMLRRKVQELLYAKDIGVRTAERATTDYVKALREYVEDNA